MVGRFILAIFSVILSSCLSEPKLKSCAEFPVDTDPDACGDPCDIYCAELLANCGDLIGASDPMAECQAACLEVADPGTFNDETGDTLACRIRHAVLAREDPDLCLNALFEGGDMCVNSQCQEYCGTMVNTCPGVYRDHEDCVAACGKFPTGGVIDTGNSVECRTHHVLMENCGAASLTSDGTCGTSCEGYCNQVVATCGSRVPFVTEEDPVITCLTLCSLMPEGESNWESDADSIQCRAWHAGSPAQLAPDAHCAHASLYNDQHCGTTCSTWCSICDEHFASFEECIPDCEARVGNGEALFPDPAAPLQCQ